MAAPHRGLLPACFAQRGRHGTPTCALFASGVCLCFLATLNFEQILLEFAAFLWLRIHRPGF
eukprot:gene46685-32247_t